MFDVYVNYEYEYKYEFPLFYIDTESYYMI